MFGHNHSCHRCPGFLLRPDGIPIYIKNERWKTGAISNFLALLVEPGGL